MQSSKLNKLLHFSKIICLGILKPKKGEFFMLTAINNSQQPSFQAKLNFKNINIPQKEEICKEFSNITKRYKSDVLDVSAEIIPRDDGTFFRNAEFNCNGGNVGYFPTLNEFRKFCKDRSPKEIAKSLARVLKLGKLYEKTEDKFSKIEENMTSVKMVFFKLETGQLSKSPKVQYNILNRLRGRLTKLNEKTTSTFTNLVTTRNKIIGNDPLLNKMEQTNFLNDINLNGQIPS